MNAEIFLPEARALAGSASAAFAWTVSLVVTKLHVNLESALGAHGAYFAYGSVCVAGAAVFVLLLPETRGKDPWEIAKGWGGGHGGGGGGGGGDKRSPRRKRSRRRSWKRGSAVAPY